MYVLDVVPIVRIPRGNPQLFSYYYSKPIEPGSVVVAEFRKKEVPMIVVSCTALAQKKAVVRSQEYQLKPIERVVADTPLLAPHTMQLVRWLSEYYFSPLSYLFMAALPPSKVLLSPTFAKHEFPPPAAQRGGSVFAMTAIWGEYDERIVERVQDVVRSNGRVLVLLPHEAYLAFWQQQLSGCDPVIFDRDRGIRSWLRVYEQIRTMGAGVVIGPPSAIFAPLPGIDLIVVIDEESRYYVRSISQPFIDVVHAARILAKQTDCSIVYTSLAPSIERYREACEGELEVINSESRGGVAVDIYSMRDTKKHEVIHPSVMGALKEVVREGGRAIIYINRRGSASLLLCRQCDYRSLCPRCEVPLALHVSPSEHLLCHRCGYTKDVPRECPECGSFDLDIRGAGIERIMQQVRTDVRGVRLFRLDSDSRDDLSSEQRVIADFQDTDGAVLCATELLFKHPLPECVALSVLAHADQALILPDYRAEERLYEAMRKLYMISQRTVAQSYHPDRPLFRRMKDPKEWYAHEISVREKLGYPPARQLIRVVYRGADLRSVQGEAARAATLFARTGIEHSPPLPCFAAKEQGYHCMELIVRTDPPVSIRQLRARNKILKYLSSGWDIYVNPADIL